MDPMIAALLDPRAYPHATEAITLTETHISWVLLTGSWAYKVKKPVSLGFVDFSSLQKRQHFCQEELRLNRRLAPQIYLDLVEIRGPAERAHLQGDGPLIDVAVRMRQFEQDALLSHALQTGQVSPEQLEHFAADLARFQVAAAVASPQGPFGTAEAVRQPALANLEVLARLQPDLAPLPLLNAWTLEEAGRLQEVFAGRLASGRVREGHGDLHLGNLVLHGGVVVAFDCLEFNPGLRWIDVLSDLAFLAMDLQRRGQPLLAGRVLNHWLIASGDYGSLLTWRWYLTYRALVRAKVLALRLQQLAPDPSPERQELVGELQDYLQQAGLSSGVASSGEGFPGAILLSHGVTGSGKSWLASHLCRRHGWIHLRSDVERRRLFGRWGNSEAAVRSGDAYSPEVSAELYVDILPAACRAVILAGLTAVVDATFLRREQRQRFRQLAQELSVPLLILSCPVSQSQARQRIRSRKEKGNDPSEADEEVLLRQWQGMEPLEGWEGTETIVYRSLEGVEEDLANRLPRLFRTTPAGLPPGC